MWRLSIKVVSVSVEFTIRYRTVYRATPLHIERTLKSHHQVTVLYLALELYIPISLSPAIT